MKTQYVDLASKFELVLVKQLILEIKTIKVQKFYSSQWKNMNDNHNEQSTFNSPLLQDPP